MHQSLGNQLKSALGSGKIKVKYPDGYKRWREKFSHFHNITKDVSETLDIIYGPGGGVNNYKGSIYRNSNVKASDMVPKKEPRSKKNAQRRHKNKKRFNKKKSDTFKFLSKDK